jgi:flavorubredoxin
MTTTPAPSATRVDEIADGIFRLSTPVPVVPGGFSFNQYLVADEEPLLFHTGPRGLFPAVREAVARVLRPESLRYVGFCHVEADECGSLNEWLAAAPQAVPLCSRVAATVSVTDLADRLDSR